MIKTSIHRLFLPLFLFLLFFNSCKKNPTVEPQAILLPNDDIRIGMAFDNEFLNLVDTASDISLLGSEYSTIYHFADSIIEKLLVTGKYKYATDFTWTLRIFHRPDIQTAFAAPGGYLYISRDLLSFLDNEADFAGVLAHTMMVSDSRWVTKKLEEKLSLSYLLDIALGGNTGSGDLFITEVSSSPYSEEASKDIDILTKDVMCQTDYDRTFDPLYCGGLVRNATKYDIIKRALLRKHQ